MENTDIQPLLDKMTSELQALCKQRHLDNPLMIGIHTGGVWIADILHQRLGLEDPLGTMDISFYRDDFTRIGIHPEVKPSKLPVTVEDRHIILVDDVLHTGRTIRAALNEIFDYGRPASVHLAVLVERDGRELPIEASVAGTHMALGDNQHVKLEGPDNLRLVVQESP
jgi:pyrimidine operon attenuation protein/uracil phosphoribosyltransferase